MVFMAVFILILSFGAINQIKIQQAVSNEQSIEYLASLINPNTEVYSTERGNFGTTVEQYFL
jgi:hypothetical protein